MIKKIKKGYVLKYLPSRSETPQSMLDEGKKAQEIALYMYILEVTY